MFTVDPVLDSLDNVGYAIANVTGPFFESVDSQLKQLDASFGDVAAFMRQPALEDSVADIAKSVGQDAATVKYLLAMVAAYPLAIIFRNLPYGNIRHLFNAMTGLFLAQFVFGSGYMHAFFTSIIAYLLLAVMSLIPALHSKRGVVVFTFAMCYMTLAHLYRLYIDYMGWSLDFTGPQMLLTIKLCALGFNLQDGSGKEGKKNRELIANPPDKEKIKDPKVLKREQFKYKLAKERMERSISELPNPLAYMGFIFCFTSYFAGPAFEIRHYLDTCSGEIFKHKERIEPVLANVVLKLLLGLVFLGCTVVGQATMPFDAATIENYILKLSPLEAIWYAYRALFFVRTKYYFAWLLTEGSANLAGFGMLPSNDTDPNKVTASVDFPIVEKISYYYNSLTRPWSYVSNVDVIGFEFAKNIQSGTRAWNQMTQSWLERYVYKRVDRSIQMYFTYFISAFWHGFYPGYYLFFMSVPLPSELDKTLRKTMNKYFDEVLHLKTVYNIIGCICTTLSMNYLASVFVVLSARAGLHWWSHIYFCGHIIFIALLFIAPNFKAPKQKPE